MRLLILLGLATLAVATQDNDLDRIARIIGGTEVKDIKKWPWLVSLHGKVATKKLGKLVLASKTFYCGGSVLNNRWILTAAHCVDNVPEAKSWKARMATVKRTANTGEKIKDFFGNLFKRKDWQNYEFGVEKIVIHKDYSAKNRWANDIALFKIKGSLPVGPKVPEVDEVKLPEAGDGYFPRPGQKCVMKGWGCTKGGGPVSNTAMEVELPIVSRVSCKKIWSVDDKRVCAGHHGQNVGICPGDSGGPLVCQRGNDWIQVGVASFAAKNNPGSFYGAFTRVSEYVNWINQQIASN